MTLADFIDYCLMKKGAEETTPFGEDILVYKVCGKVFAITWFEDVPTRANLKCAPERALELRDEYESIIPGYHMNKRHWNTIIMDGTLTDKMIRELVDHSYTLVLAGLKKADREKLDKK